MSVWQRGGQPTFRRQARDISPSGIGFISSDPLELGSVCGLGMKTQDGRLLSVTGIVRHCDQIDDGHYIGIELDHEIDVSALERRQ